MENKYNILKYWSIYCKKFEMGKFSALKKALELF